MLTQPMVGPHAPGPGPAVLMVREQALGLRSGLEQGGTECQPGTLSSYRPPCHLVTLFFALSDYLL